MRIGKLIGVGVVAAATLLVASCAAAAPADLSKDEEAIKSTLMGVLQSIRTGNAEGLAELYTDDADFTNAFGTRLTGGPAIEEYMTGLYANEHFAAGELVGEPEVSVRPLGEGAVVAHVRTTIVGQETQDGGQLGERDTNSLHILEKQADGAWLIAVQMFADARTESTYKDGGQS